MNFLEKLKDEQQEFNIYFRHNSHHYSCIIHKNTTLKELYKMIHCKICCNDKKCDKLYYHLWISYNTYSYYIHETPNLIIDCTSITKESTINLHFMWFPADCNCDRCIKSRNYNYFIKKLISRVKHDSRYAYLKYNGNTYALLNDYYTTNDDYTKN